MAHYNIAVEMKDKKPIPVEWIPAIRKIIACFDYDKAVLETDRFVLCCFEYWHDYQWDLECAAQDSLISRDIVEFYSYAKENMRISTDCWNANDKEFGPQDWDEFEKLWLDDSTFEGGSTIRRVILDKENERKRLCGEERD